MFLRRNIAFTKNSLKKMLVSCCIVNFIPCCSYWFVSCRHEKAKDSHIPLKLALLNLSTFEKGNKEKRELCGRFRHDLHIKRLAC